MFVDASALVALMSSEPEAERIATALGAAQSPVTSPIAIFEAVLALSRPDKFGVPVQISHNMLLEFILQRGIQIRDLPPAKATLDLAVHAAQHYRGGRHGLNLGDCLHYAFAKFHSMSVLTTDMEFRRTDLQVID
jgi:ribonuclease VapC